SRCWRAHLCVMRNAVNRYPKRYHAIIGEKLWINAGYAAGCSDWETARESAALARALVRQPKWGSRSFRIAAGLLGEPAVFVREGLIRTFKRHLRSTPNDKLSAAAAALMSSLFLTTVHPRRIKGVIPRL